ncbi:MAG: HAD-IA family hydrolase [Candidatus Thorarchaeota archaeon]|nr:HAD-IA family hydrolase [Candidatus Thorarchaeota archaeon]
MSNDEFMFKALLVDMDGVIRHVDVKTAEEESQSIGFTFAELSSHLWKNPLIRKLITGQITRDQWWKILQKQDTRFEKFDQDRIWNGVFRKNIFDWKLVDYVRDAGKFLTTAIVTNCDGVSKKRIFQELGNNSPFDHVFSSSDFGFAKPESEIFSAVLNELGMQGEDCMFFDDSLSNVETARTLGIHAFHFVDFESFRTTVESMTKPVHP